MTRFRPPTLAQDMADCQGCGWHGPHEGLDDDGFCRECRAPKEVQAESLESSPASDIQCDTPHSPAASSDPV